DPVACCPGDRMCAVLRADSPAARLFGMESCVASSDGIGGGGDDRAAIFQCADGGSAKSGLRGCFARACSRPGWVLKWLTFAAVAPCGCLTLAPRLRIIEKPSPMSGTAQSACARDRV